MRINPFLFGSIYFRTFADSMCWAYSSAGTTDAIFHEKAQLYDLIIDLAPPSSTPSASPYAPTASPSSPSPPIYKPARPISYVSRLVVSVPPASDAASSYSSSNSFKLSAVRFTWSDVRLVSTNVTSLRVWKQILIQVSAVARTRSDPRPGLLVPSLTLALASSPADARLCWRKRLERRLETLRGCVSRLRGFMDGHGRVERFAAAYRTRRR